MLHALLVHLGLVGPDWLWHPLGNCPGTHAEVVRCRSYNFWSGIEGAVGEITLIGGALAMLKRINCHQRGCWRIGRFPHGPYKLCHRHHPLVPDDGVIGDEQVAAVAPSSGPPMLHFKGDPEQLLKALQRDRKPPQDPGEE